MCSIKELTEALENLSADLEGSGKSETAQFFRNIIDDIYSAKDLASCQESLEKIINSGAISQYAGFNYKQDMLFDRVFDVAKKLTG